MRTNRRGVSLLELVAATTIIAMTLVPALGMMRDSLRIGREIETATLMATLCVDKVEEYLTKTSANWQNSNLTGDFAAIGFPQLKYEIARSDSSLDGGIPDSLMALEATVWDDTNDNDSWEDGEHRVNFAAKLAKVTSYEYEAIGL